MISSSGTPTPADQCTTVVCFYSLGHEVIMHFTCVCEFSFKKVSATLPMSLYFVTYVGKEMFTNGSHLPEQTQISFTSALKDDTRYV